MTFRIGHILLCTILFACGASGDSPTPECTPGEPVMQADPCTTCVCTDQGAISCTPQEPDSVCVPSDCCVVNATCQICDGPDCPSSGLSCQGSTELICDTTTGCSINEPTCVEGACACQEAALPDGTQCTADPNACTTGDSCVDGGCQAGPPASLDDGNPCTAGLCVKGEIEQKILDGSCSDGNPCTLSDRCVLGQCLPDSLVVCPNKACAQGVCDPTQGECVYDNVANGSPCVDDEACDSLGTCDQGECLSEGQDCDDENPCTMDSCSDGLCTHVEEGDGTQCSNPQACVDQGTCQAGQCVAPGQDPCLVEEACKIASCSADGACDIQNAADGSLCSEESACGVLAGTCQDGACSAQGTLCDDNNPCTTDGCGPQGCTFADKEDGAACDDGNLCNGLETCQQGFCGQGTPPNCETNIDCFLAQCVPEEGCVFTPDPDCAQDSFQVGKTVYFGGPQVITGLIPDGVSSVAVHVWGGGGGGGFPGTGGGGAYVAAQFSVSPGDALELSIAGGSLTAGGGGGASYIKKNATLTIVAGGGGGAGLDGCSGCGAEITDGCGGGAGPAGGAGEDGTANNNYQTGSNGGSGGTQSGGGAGGVSDDNSVYTQTPCDGGAGGANTGGAPAQAKNDGPCQSEYAGANFENGSANANNGVGGAGGAGLFGGGAGAGKWTYSGGGGGGGSSFVGGDAQLLATEGGQNLHPGGAQTEHYENNAGAGGPTGAGSSANGISGMIVLILSP